MTLQWFKLVLFIQVTLSYTPQKHINQRNNVPHKTQSNKQIEKVIPARYKVMNNAPIYEPIIVKHLDHPFQQVEYPSDISDVSKPFYFQPSDSDSLLSPFSHDVKSNFKSIVSQVDNGKPKMDIDDYSSLIQLIQSLKTNGNSVKQDTASSDAPKVIIVLNENDNSNKMLENDALPKLRLVKTVSMNEECLEDSQEYVFTDEELVPQNFATKEQNGNRNPIVTVVEETDEFNNMDYAVLEEPPIASEDQYSEVFENNENEVSDIAEINSSNIEVLFGEQVTEEQISSPVVLEDNEQLCLIEDDGTYFLISDSDTKDIPNKRSVCKAKSKPNAVPLRRIALPEIPNSFVFKNNIVKKNYNK